jgi:hypothetical protein
MRSRAIIMSTCNSCGGGMVEVMFHVEGFAAGGQPMSDAGCGMGSCGITSHLQR